MSPDANAADNDEPAIALLAGGASRRMGRDKALLPWGERSLLAAIAARLRESGLNVAVVGRERPEDWPLSDVAFLPDERDGLGPLGGLCTALAALERDVILLACDMPFADAALVGWLRASAAQSTAAHGVVGLHEGRPQPLCACYRRAVLPLARELLQSERRALRELLALGEFEQRPLPAELIARLTDVDTPEDWRRLRHERPAEQDEHP